MAIDIREDAEGVTLPVRVQPRASRDGLGGEREGALVVRLTAPPVEGAANEALQRFLGRAFGLPPTSVRIVAGATGRNKRVNLPGLAKADILARLAEAPAKAPAKMKARR
jgi:uncharacterized protein (TIGR00251 family)